MRRPQFFWTRIKGESDVEGGGGQVANLGEHVRQLAGQYTQEQEKHATWIGESGVRVTTLTDAYDSLLKNVNRMIDASNSVTSELEELFR